MAAADDAALVERARAWAAADPDKETRAELEALIVAGDIDGLHARFDEPLDFGTAGLRGALGAGPGRMNRVVVRATTAGLSRWVLDQGQAAADAGIVVGRDARHGSEAFAADTVEVAANAGLHVFRLPRPLPTPITAFAVRKLATTAGVMVTASHNPAEDNGYKAYVTDGAQIIPPDDRRVAELAAALGAPQATGLSEEGRRRVADVDESRLLDAYAEAVFTVLDPGAPRDLSIVYSPLHGVGGAVVPDLFARADFSRPEIVAAQAVPDPDFPTVPFPNPEEPGALDYSLATARERGADLVVCNDPDADRLAIAVFDRTAGDYRQLSGNEVGALLGDYLIERTSGNDRLVATTIVSSQLLAKIAAASGVAYAETLTGFKWVARAQKTRPGHHLLFGYEEALGYAVSEAVADKDGMSAGLLAAELAAKEKASGRSLLDRLDELALRFGVHTSAQLSLRKEGREGIVAFSKMMERLRLGPPPSLVGRPLRETRDYRGGRDGLPPSDVIALFYGDDVRVVVRPSGTEPKLKCYLEVTTPPPARTALESARTETTDTVAALRRQLAAVLEG